MANNKHAVVRIDKLGGTLDGAQLESVIFYKESDAAEIDNAQLVVLGEKLGREVYKATAPTATSTVADLYLTAGVELFYDQTVAHYLPEWVNEQFNVTFVISGEDAPSDFEWSAGEDFQLVWGPQKGRSSSMSIVNGHRTKTSQTTYTYILMPKKTGHFRLQAAQVKVKGKHYSSDMPEVEVVSDGAKSQGGASSSGSQGGGNAAQSVGSVSPEDMFLRLTLSKRKLMVGEPVTATLKLYQRVNIAGIENAKFPDFNGFWSQEIQALSNIEFKRESLDEKIYNTAVLRSWTLIPQKAGEIRIAPAELVCLVNVRTQRQSTGSIFDDFFMDDFQTVRKRVTTDPLTVTVSALPYVSDVAAYIPDILAGRAPDNLPRRLAR